MILLQDLLWRHVIRQKTEIKRGIQANSRKIVKHLMSKITQFSYISVRFAEIRLRILSKILSNSILIALIA